MKQVVITIMFLLASVGVFSQTSQQKEVYELYNALVIAMSAGHNHIKIDEQYTSDSKVIKMLPDTNNMKTTMSQITQMFTTVMDMSNAWEYDKDSDAFLAGFDNEHSYVQVGVDMWYGEDGTLFYNIFIFPNI